MHVIIILKGNEHECIVKIIIHTHPHMEYRIRKVDYLIWQEIISLGLINLYSVKL